MCQTRLTLVTMLGVVAWLMLADGALSQDSPRAPRAPGQRAPVPEGFQPGAPPPAGPQAPAGPRNRPGPAGAEDFGPPMGPPLPGGPGLRPRDGSQRPGPPDGRGGPGPGRLNGPPHPPGPPRWPHDDWESLQKNDPEMYRLLQEDYDLERQTRALAMQYRQAPKDQRDGVKQEIEKLVLKHFEVRQQRRALELKRLEEELQRLRDSIDQRNKVREEIVKKRVSELLGLDDELRF